MTATFPMVPRIPVSVHQHLGFYVYVYIDPRDDSVFYVGKGKGERALAHLKDSTESDKVQRITELTKLGLTPRIDILRYGLSQQEALHVEAAAIELLGIESLTNRVLGHSFDLKRRSRLEDLIQELDAKEVTISHPCVLINISQMYRHGMTAIELYDATRKSWVIGARRDQVQLAMAIYRGIVREVYEIAAWLPAGSTMTGLGTIANVVDPPLTAPHSNRFEFVGRIAEEKIRNRYLGKSVRNYFAANSQNPIRYAP
jgi:uncharacterized protein